MARHCGIALGLVVLLGFGGADAQEKQAKKKAAAKKANLPDGVAVERDVVYGKAGSRELVLDVYRPKNPPSKKLPILVYIHGGAWSGGNKMVGGAFLPAFAANGVVGFSIGYRLTGEAAWPAQIHDCKAAIRWIRAHATDYGADPDKIAAMGHSAGGHLVALLGTSGDVDELEGKNGTPGVSSRIQAVVDVFGPTELYSLGKKPHTPQGKQVAKSALTALFGGTVDEKKKDVDAASPVTYVTKDDPPFLILHGTEDPLVPLSQSELLRDKLKDAGVSVALITVKGGAHGDLGQQANGKVAAFLNKQLRGQGSDVESATFELRGR